MPFFLLPPPIWNRRTFGEVLGIVYEKFHGRDFARRGGMFELTQLWVNLPAQDKRRRRVIAAGVEVIEGGL